MAYFVGRMWCFDDSIIKYAQRTDLARVSLTCSSPTHVTVRGSVEEVTEKLMSAMRGGSPNVIGTDFMPYRGDLTGGGK